MTTSLAEQLQRLAVPQTSVFKEDKQKLSLLFDPKEAAGIRKEAIYQISLDGLEELIVKNPVFAQFKENIFNFASKDFERSVHDLQTNKRLDKLITKYLILLSPYFLLNCAQKTLEWLIRRYHIHEYNREELLLCIMPYHESNIFVRVIQLMKFKETNDSWYFLKPLQKTGVHLIKNNLINHAATDEYFLKFITKYIKLMIKEHDNPTQLIIAFNFYCTVFVGVIETSKQLKENQISQILPAVLKGLKSDVPDYCAATYVIVARMLVKINLNESILDKLVLLLSDVTCYQLRKEAVLTLVILYQSQNGYGQMPDEGCLNLIKNEWLVTILEQLNSSSCLIHKFVEQLIGTALKCSNEDIEDTVFNFIKELFSKIKFEEESITRVLRVILDSNNIDDSPSVKTNVGQLVKTIERQYPDAFDREVMKIMSSTGEGEESERKQKLNEVFANVMTLKSAYEIFEKLYNPNPQIRLKAVKFVKNNIKKLKNKEIDMIKNSITHRLNDDDISVVKETVSLVKNLPDLYDDEIKYSIIKLLIKWRKHRQSDSISSNIIEFLCDRDKTEDYEILLVICSYLLTKPTMIATVIESKYFKNNNLLKKFQSKSINSGNDSKLLQAFLNHLDANKSRNLSEKCIKSWLNIVQYFDDFYKYLSVTMLSHIISHDLSLEIFATFLKNVENYLNGLQLEINRSSANIVDSVNMAANNEFPLRGFLNDLKKVVLKIQKIIKLDNLNLYDDNYEGLIVVSLVNIFVSKNSYDEFLDLITNLTSNQIAFLLHLLITDKLDDSIKINTANSIQNLLQNADTPTKIDNLTLCYLLVSLLNSNRKLRKTIVKMLNFFENHNILRELQQYKEEIILDHEQIPLVVYNIMKSKNLKCNISKIIIDTMTKVKCPIYVVSGSLTLLSHIDSLEIFEKTSKIALDILRENTTHNLNVYESEIITLNILRLQPSIASKLNTDMNVWKFLEVCVRNDETKMEDRNNLSTCCVVLLENLDAEFFSKLNYGMTEYLLNVIIETVTKTKNPDVLPYANRLFKHAELDSKMFLSILTKMRDCQSPKQNLTKKKRIRTIPTIDILDLLEWRKGVTVLEFIQNKKKINNVDCLVSVLFQILKKCLDFDEQAAVEYSKQLVLSSIYNFCSKLDGNIVSESDFNIELVVQCIRASPNPQTHHNALLVLTYAVKLVPNQVLHHIMAIFTFMGSSVLRHDDAYSFQIISKILDTLIPILLDDKRYETIGKVLRVFADALLDVPEHRRVPLYKQLLTITDPKETLHLFLLLVFESHITHQSNQAKSKESKHLEVAAEICHQFSPGIVLHSCIKLLKYLLELPEEKTDDADSNSVTFNIKYHTPKQFRHYKYTLITFMVSLLSSVEFLNQIAALKHDSDDDIGFEELYKDIIVNTLTYIQRVVKVVEKSADTPQFQYWKVILHHSYDILDSTNALLTPEMFLLVMKGLIVHKIVTIRRRALELLNTKLQYNSQFIEECNEDNVQSLIPALISIITTVQNDNIESDQEIVIQTALLSLKLLLKFLVPTHKEKLIQILEFMCGILKCDKIQNNVQASMILCLAELVVTLHTSAIPYLTDFMPVILKILKKQKNPDSPSLLLLSCVTAIQKLLEVLILFMSPYLEKILTILCPISDKFDDAKGDPKIQSISNKIKSILQKIGTNVPSRILIPMIEKCYHNLIEKSKFEAIGPLIETLIESIRNLKDSEVKLALTELGSFFLNTLDFRNTSDLSNDIVDVVENYLIKALTTLVLKLSETNFRPFYYKLFDWAVRCESRNARIITFYHLSSEIAACLKGLFVLFAGHFLNNASEILDACNQCKNQNLYFEDIDKNIVLLEYVLKTLSVVFSYDDHKFINSERFQVLMQPVADQLENDLGGLDRLQKRNQELLTPCIVNFTVAVADDALWKQLNYQILLKMRHNSPENRLVALHCFTEVVRRLSDDFLPLLPETIPFLAELLEDEDERVEKACQKTIQQMEKILGEPIQKYF